MLYHLSPATDDGQPLPELHAPFSLGPSSLLCDRRGIRAKWEVTAPQPASTVTIYQNVRLVSQIAGVESGRFFCEAWEVADGVPPAQDYKIVPAITDPRELRYICVTVSWMENGPAPEHFRLGVDDQERVTQPWAWAAGANGWRAYRQQAAVMIRTVRIHREREGLQRIWEERRYGCLPASTDPAEILVPRWLPRTEMSTTPPRGASDHTLDELQLRPAASSRLSQSTVRPGEDARPASRR